MLILLGLAFGLIFRLHKHNELHKYLVFDTRVFFLFLLPPIILEAAYSLSDKAFFANLAPILLFAVIGTLLNVVLLATALYGLHLAGVVSSLNLDMLDCLIFSSAIASVDPVAVLAIFQEVGVNKVLYFMVFGESLLNDGVAVVMYNMMLEVKGVDTIGPHEIELGLAAFFVTTFGGIGTGLLCGFTTAYVTKHTATEKVQVVEPILLFGFGYLSYIFAELFHFSGIISIICCGLFQAQYANHNISGKSRISVHYFSKVTSTVTESLIFIILGVMLVNDLSFWQGWRTDFTFMSLVMMIFIRFLVVLSLMFLVNTFLLGSRRITFKEQFVVAYGGLRGAIAFSLIFMLRKDMVPSRDALLSATYFIILFTVFVQGTTMKPIVAFFEISLQKSLKRTLIQEMTKSGISRYCERHFIRPILQKDAYTSGVQLITTYQEQSLARVLSPTTDERPPEGPAERRIQLSEMAPRQPQLENLQPTGASSEIRPSGVQRLRDAVENRVLGASNFQDSVYLRSLFRAKRKSSRLHNRIHCTALDRNLSHEESESRIQRDFEHLSRIREQFPWYTNRMSERVSRFSLPASLGNLESAAPRTTSMMPTTTAPIGFCQGLSELNQSFPTTDSDEEGVQRTEFFADHSEKEQLLDR